MAFQSSFINQQSSISSRRNRSMSKLKVVVVGAGGMGHAWADNLKKCDEVQTVGWVDIRPGAAQAGIEKQQLSGAKAYEDFGKALAEAKPDFVVDVTVPEAHYDITLQALAA